MAGEHLPPLSPRWWDQTLRARGPPESGLPLRFRLIRSEGRRAVVEVDQRTVGLARSAWPGSLEGGATLATVRTWGTLVGAKAWLRSAPPGT